MAEQLQIVYRKASELTPYAANARTHSAEQIEQLRASIREFGWTNPILVQEDGGIIAGHGRLEAGILEGWDEVPTICIAGLTEEQRRALVIADNKLALNAGWNDATLRLEIEALQAAQFDVGVIGFSVDELTTLFAQAPGPEAGGGTGGDDGRKPVGSLSERFMLPPFTVLNAREGWWQERKRAWLALGIKSELGRGGQAGMPSHGPTVTQNPDGTLNYRGAKREDWDKQMAAGKRKAAAEPDGSPIAPAGDATKQARAPGRRAAGRSA